MTVKFQDYYEILGVDRNATQDQIKRAHRKRARQYHPDLNKGKDVEEKFKQISEAYEVLSDPETRKKYDQLGANWKAGQEFTPPSGWENVRFDLGGGGPGRTGGVEFGADGFSDFFEMLFGANGRRPRGQGGFEQMFRGGGGSRTSRSNAPGPVEATITITIEDAYHGTTQQVALQDPATGNSRVLHVKIPPGVTSGSKIRLAGQAGGSPPGDVLLKIAIARHERFEVRGHDLHTTVAITPWEAALGAKVPLQTPAGRITLTVPAGSQSGQKLRLRDKGLPQRGGGGQRGGLFVQLKIVVPKRLSDRERELFELLADESSFEPRANG